MLAISHMMSFSGWTGVLPSGTLSSRQVSQSAIVSTLGPTIRLIVSSPGFPPLAFRDQLLLRTPPSLRSQSTEQCIIILGSFYSGCRASGPYIIFKSSD
ncbi:hypothetical protein B0H11DRAFT_2205156 [Mycena galericulata]|nr:hypothetical protein B0H11DRAFT_2205156 [Mycena galericulata]